MTTPAPCISGKCVVLQAGQDFRFSNFWRQTFVRSCVRGQGTFSARREVRVKHMYSDVLYSSWHWAHAKLRPEWLDGDTIPRIAASEMSLQRFINEFEQPNRPVIITGLVRPAAICRGTSSQASCEDVHGDRGQDTLGPGGARARGSFPPAGRSVACDGPVDGRIPAQGFRRSQTKRRRLHVILGQLAGLLSRQQVRLGPPLAAAPPHPVTAATCTRESLLVLRWVRIAGTTIPSTCSTSTASGGMTAQGMRWWMTSQ